MDCKVGDIVHVRGKVMHVGRLWVDVNFEDDAHRGGLSKFALDAIVHVESRPIAVGDTVRHKLVGVTFLGHHMARMHVNAIVDGRAWCRSSGYDYIIEVEKLECVS